MVVSNLVWFLYLNLFMHNVEKWSDIPKKSCGVSTARFLYMFGQFSTYEKVNPNILSRVEDARKN